MGEPQEAERFRLVQPPGRPVRGGEPPELDQPGLIRVQLQAESRHPLAEVGQEALRIPVVLEAADEVVGEPHDDHLTACPVPPPPLDPKIQRVVQVHVGEQRRCRCPLRRPGALAPDPLFHDPRGQPLTDQPQDPLIRDPVPEEPFQPAAINAGEKVADVRVQHPVHLLPLDPDRQRVQRVMLAAARPEPVGEPPEVRLVDGVQYLDDGPLEDLVLQRGDAERRSRPSAFGMYALRDGLAR